MSQTVSSVGIHQRKNINKICVFSGIITFCILALDVNAVSAVGKAFKTIDEVIYANKIQTFLHWLDSAVGGMQNKNGY